MGEGRALFTGRILVGRPGLTLFLQRLTFGILRYMRSGVFEFVVAWFVGTSVSSCGARTQQRNERITTEKSKIEVFLDP